MGIVEIQTDNAEAFYVYWSDSRHVTGISLSNFPISRHVQYKVKVTREDVGRHLHTRVSRLRTDDEVTAARGRVSSLLSLPVQVLQNLRPRHEADRGWAGRGLLVSALGLRQRVSPPPSHLLSSSLFGLQVFRETWSWLRLISTSELWSFLHSSNTLPLLLSLLHQRQDFPRCPSFSICKLIIFCLLSVFCYQNGIIFLLRIEIQLTKNMNKANCLSDVVESPSNFKINPE